MMFLFSAGVILSNAEHFSEALVATGKVFGIDEFLLVQWLAPVASEAPELTVATMFALRGHAATALGSLLSAKLNQWTLLVGMIPGVYGLSSGSFEAPIPMGNFQMNEIILTAAQSLLAVSLIVGLRLDSKGALLLFGLFVGQFLASGLMAPFSGSLPYKVSSENIHLFFSVIYIVASICFLLRNRAAVVKLRHGLRTDDVDERHGPELAFAKSCSPLRRINPEAAIEGVASRSTYRE